MVLSGAASVASARKILRLSGEIAIRLAMGTASAAGMASRPLAMISVPGFCNLIRINDDAPSGWNTSA